MVTEVPIASPASGIIYTQDPALHIPVRSGQETFGPILTARGDTLGAHKIFVASTYQHFEFTTLDAVNLKSVPTVFEFCNGPQCVPAGTINRLDFKVNQIVFYATYGLFRQVDVSLAIPIVDVHAAIRSYRCTVAQESNSILRRPQERLLGWAMSFFVFRGKYLPAKNTRWPWERIFALRVETR